MAVSKSSLTAESFVSVDQATTFLLGAAKVMCVNHLSYWYLQYVDAVPEQVIWVATYDPAYMNYYMKHFTPVNDPVIATVMHDKYVDWAEWLPTDELAQEVEKIAPRYGITKYGISIPIVAQKQDKVIFSSCISSNDSAWPEDRSRLARLILPFAEEFHHRMTNLIVQEKTETGVFRLFA